MDILLNRETKKINNEVKKLMLNLDTANKMLKQLMDVNSLEEFKNMMITLNESIQRANTAGATIKLLSDESSIVRWIYINK